MDTTSILKPEWNDDRYKEWFASLLTKNTPANTLPDIFEIKHTGGRNYLLKGSGEELWADGIADRTVLEAKMIVTPKRSPFISGSSIPETIRGEIVGKVGDEFRRASIIMRDEGNPLTSMRVYINHPGAKPFFEELMREHNIPGEVIVVRE